MVVVWGFEDCGPIFFIVIKKIKASELNNLYLMPLATNNDQFSSHMDTSTQLAASFQWAAFTDLATSTKLATSYQLATSSELTTSSQPSASH